MIEKTRVNDYCNHYYINQLKDSRVGLKLAIIGFTLFIYADFFLFEYPAIVTICRALLITYYSVALFLTYRFEAKTKFLKVVLSISCFLSLAFGGFIAIYIASIKADDYYRASQVYILITIGSILFSGIIKAYLNYLIGVILALYIFANLVIYGLNIEIFYMNFNVIFLSISAIVFNYLFIRSRVYEFEAIHEKNNKIAELEGEIVKRQQLQYKLKEMATYDGLTKAYTRAIGLNMLAKSMSNADLEYKSVSIIYLDVNGLKIINDTYGHQVGDLYIVGLVEIINHNIRSKDYCIRLGGDEFLVVLPNTSYFEAERLWREIQVNIAMFEVEEEQAVMPLKVSHGLAEYTNNNYQSIEYFLDAADDKMYKEKKFNKKKALEESMKSLLELKEE